VSHCLLVGFRLTNEYVNVNIVLESGYAQNPYLLQGVKKTLYVLALACLACGFLQREDSQTAEGPRFWSYF
jgi:hypothetical protein